MDINGTMENDTMSNDEMLQLRNDLYGERYIIQQYINFTYFNNMSHDLLDMFNEMELNIYDEICDIENDYCDANNIDLWDLPNNAYVTKIELNAQHQWIVVE